MNVERHTRAWLSTILQRCWIVSVIVSPAFHPCEAQHTIPTASTSCQPVIKVAHSSISCFDLKNSNNVQFPTVDSPCGGAITSWSYQDAYYELSARLAPGFAGYFDLSRWEKRSGDGGVDVTGAPNGILVEGANIAKVNVAPQMEAILRIVIPAEGYATFDWKNIGGSNLLLEASVNAKLHRSRTPGIYRTPLLNVGDTLSLRFTAAEASQVQLANFHFYTNAVGVTERRWTAQGQQAQMAVFQQFITVERPPIANVIFPDNWDSPTNAATLPNTTGFPVLDADGDFKTLQDQHILDKNECGFNVRWEDKIQGGSLVRHWVIEDVYNGNVLEHTQQIQIGASAPPVLAPEASTQPAVPNVRPATSTGTTTTKSVSNTETTMAIENYGSPSAVQ